MIRMPASRMSNGTMATLLRGLARRPCILMGTAKTVASSIRGLLHASAIGSNNRAPPEYQPPASRNHLEIRECRPCNPMFRPVVGCVPHISPPSDHPAPAFHMAKRLREEEGRRARYTVSEYVRA